MQRDRITTAFARMDEALARIEAVAENARHAPATSRLVERTLQLEEALGETITEIDRLVGMLER